MCSLLNSNIVTPTFTGESYSIFLYIQFGYNPYTWLNVGLFIVHKEFTLKEV